MSKEFDEYIVDKQNLNLITKEEISLLKIKIGKSHRTEKDWEIIKNIFQERDVLTFTPVKRVRGIKNVEKILCMNGLLFVYSNIDDCESYIRALQQSGKIERYAQIASIPFLDVIEIAHMHRMDVIIDAIGEKNSKCFMYMHESKELKVVILAQA